MAPSLFRQQLRSAELLQHELHHSLTEAATPATTSAHHVTRVHTGTCTWGRKNKTCGWNHNLRSLGSAHTELKGCRQSCSPALQNS
jgi:hypothetical protein